LVGAVGENEDRVTAITPPVGLVLAALGGCMVPLEVFPSAMRTVAKITPHAWAIEAWETLVFDQGGVGDIVTNLAVLAAFAVGLLGLASVVLGRRLQRA
jgi:ABC-2 type transport system permease protein